MKIVVAYGGTSPEREVSLNSGAAVANALSGAGVDVVLYDVVLMRDFVCKWNSFNADGVFIALHGGWGEDGRFQALLEAFDIPYTGSSVEACICAMDKSLAKLLFSKYKVPVPDGFSVMKGSCFKDKGMEFLEKYGRLIVKPNGGGSTVGVSQAGSIKELEDALNVAWLIEPNALVESYIEGKEVTVPVFEKINGDTVALPIIEIRPKTGFYDYKNKYTKGCTDYICPAPFSSELTEKLSRAAVFAHKSLGCRGYSRVDFRVTKSGDIYALEVNTAPGMTATSLVPKSAFAYGLSFSEFLKHVIQVSFGIKR